MQTRSNDASTTDPAPAEGVRAGGTPALEGQVAIVTGAAKGMGAPISAALQEQGARLVLGGRDVAALEAYARTLSERDSLAEVEYARCDVASEDDTRALAELALERFGRIDILVNTAGTIGPIETPAHEVELSQFREVIDVNLTGTFLACKAVIPAMIERRYGRIVNIAGTSGLRGYRNRVSYSSSKWAVRGLTRTLALELGPYGITVNDICPNVTDGARMQKIVAGKAAKLGKRPDEIYEDFARQTALGRFIEESDVAAAMNFLVSPGARNITGQDIVVDAGWDV